MKKRLLCLMASLLLCGAVSAQHFTAPDAHAKSGNTPIVAAVTVDNVAPATGAELAVFVGEGENEELRGLATTTLDGKYWVQVFYNTGSTETLTFKLWNPTDEGEGTELDTYTLTYGDLTALTTREEGYGTPSTPVVLSFTTTQTMTQTTALVSGWTWWSTYIEQNGSNGLEQLENSLGNACLIIKSRHDGDIEPLPIGDEIIWLGQLMAIHNEQMYMIQTNAVCNTNLSGQIATPLNHPIAIEQGWNWIGYPNGESVNLNDALGGFNPQEGDQIKGRSGSADYLEALGLWIGDLTVLNPGQGYMYYSNNATPQTLVYQLSRQGVVSSGSHQTNKFFVPQEFKYERNMTITAVIEIDGQELYDDNYEVAAFVNGECRGSAKVMYVEPLDRYIAFLLAFGDIEENMSFVLTNGEYYNTSSDQIRYSNDSRFGSLSNPGILHFGSTGVNFDEQVFANVYPNPSSNIFTVECVNTRKYEVINAFGQTILSKECIEDSFQIDLSNKACGAYLLRIITDNGTLTKHIIKQ